jgi:hypothetical protein
MRNFVPTLLLSLVLMGCAGTARKDVYFRSRLPTMEDPDISKAGHLGLIAEVQTARFSGRLTRNLAESLTFVKGQSDFTKSDNIAGRDLFLSYADEASKVPFQVAVTSDQAKIKVRVFDFREDTVGFFSSVNYAVAETTMYDENGACGGIICFESRSSKDLDLENSIKVSHSGLEQKVGASLGYTYAPMKSVYIGYQWYDARLTAEASQNGNTAYFQESFYGHGIGLGLMYRGSDRVKVTGTVEDIHIYWNTQNLQETVFSLNLEWSMASLK